MSNNASNMYRLDLDQAANLIKTIGDKRTVLLQGDMGSGKSSVLYMLDAALPKHKAMYFDCTTKDLGDIMIPIMKDLDGEDYVRFATNEELGLHLKDYPIVLMLDEYGKANPMVKNALLRLMLERKTGGYEMHPDSLIFATTNLGSEGVGDLLMPHARNRITVVTTRKPENMKWIEWGINNGVDHALLGWCKDNPQLFHSFEDVSDPKDNPYIYHPAEQREAFVTPRSLEAASDLLKVRHLMDDTTLTAGLMGTIGARGAMDLAAFVRLADQLPSLDDIKKDPNNAKVPDSAAAVCMVVYRTLSALERSWIDAWLEYLVRLDPEAQGLFVNGARVATYTHRSLLFQNRKFTDWARKNSYMFSEDGA